MKKKIISLIAISVCAIGCAAALVACGGDGGNNGGGGNNDAYVTGLIFVDKDGGEHHYYSSDSFVYGSRPSYDSVKLYIEYSDGTKREAGDNDSDKIKIEYSYNGETLAQAPTSFAPGRYEESYKYGELSPITYSYKIVTTATATPYSINITSEWKYGEEPTVTVRDSSSEVVDKTKYNVRYIDVDKYDEIKNAADFTEKLQQEGGIAYSSTSNSEQSPVYLNVQPGEYYFFALFTNDGLFNSTLQKVTIKKGTLEPVYTGELEDLLYLANNWWSTGETGKVNISEIAVGVNGNDITWNDRNGEQYRSSYSIEWKNPDEQVDCSVDGQKRQIKCVFADDCYEDYIFPDPITVKFGKATLNWHGIYGTIMYDGEDHDIVLKQPNSDDPYSGEELEKFNKMVTVKDADGNPVTIGEGGVLATVRDEGEYTYTFVLKDKANYDWWWSEYDENSEQRVDVRTTDDLTSTFTIYPLSSWIQPFSNGYDVNIDENKQIKLKLNPGTDSYVNNCTPYKSGTLQVAVLSEYTIENSSTTYTTEIEASAEIVTEGGFDYIVITVTDFKGKEYSGCVVLEVKATGDQHYEDIDRVFYSLYVKKYSTVCPLAAVLEDTNDTMEQPAGITVAELYATYPDLINPLGKWVLYMDYYNDGQWTKLADTAALPQMSLSCKLVFESDSDFVNIDWIDEYEFTLVGTAA